MLPGGSRRVDKGRPGLGRDHLELAGSKTPKSHAASPNRPRCAVYRECVEVCEWLGGCTLPSISKMRCPQSAHTRALGLAFAPIIRLLLACLQHTGAAAKPKTTITKVKVCYTHTHLNACAAWPLLFQGAGIRCSAPKAQQAWREIMRCQGLSKHGGAGTTSTTHPITKVGCQQRDMGRWEVTGWPRGCAKGRQRWGKSRLRCLTRKQHNSRWSTRRRARERRTNKGATTMTARR